jgi:AmmeMemoRadiSam system protein B/AmmeMemoRadiSam system protein A
MRLFFLHLLVFLTLSPGMLFSQEVKKPAVSGTFYPSSKEELARAVDKFIEEADVKSEKGDIIAAIAPHAGYVYSGSVAGYTYKAIKDKAFKLAILMGPSHFEFFDGISVYNKGSFQTPLGNVEIDAESANKLIKENPKISFYPKAFDREHSLEVQLPFLQRIREDFKIVPVIIGNPSFENCKILADAIVNVIKKRDDVIIIASTDLSHYHKYEEALNIDRFTLSELSKLEPETIFTDYSNGSIELCGAGAVLTAVIASRALGAKSLGILKYANSGDTAGDMSRVVGYASGIFTGKSQEGDGEYMLDEKEKNKLLYIARHSIESYLKNGAKPALIESDPKLLEKKGAFVTITINGELRGCIGSIYPALALYQIISDMAIEAASGDPRFSPLGINELDKIKIEISVLSALEKITDTSRIKTGEHGLLIRKGFHSGLLLPQVATEYGWEREEFLQHTCNKAGLDRDAWKKGAEIYIFSASVFSEKEEKQ